MSSDYFNIELRDFKDLCYRIYQPSYMAMSKDEKYFLTFMCKTILSVESGGFSKVKCEFILKPLGLFSKFSRLLWNFKSSPDGFLKITKLKDSDDLFDFFQGRVNGTLYFDIHSFNGIIANLENLSGMEFWVRAIKIGDFHKSGSWKPYEQFANEGLYYEESENADFFIVTKFNVGFFN